MFQYLYVLKIICILINNTHTFLTSRVFARLSVSGCVVISKRRKFCFSVVKTPFSTRFFASLSLTFFNWYRNFNGFHVSPKKQTKVNYIGLFLIKLWQKVLLRDLNWWWLQKLLFLKIFEKISLPLRYSIQLWTVSGGSVSFICFNASSNKTSPVGALFFNNNFLVNNPLFLMPAFSSSTLPLSPSSAKMQPRNAELMQSFQKDV